MSGSGNNNRIVTKKRKLSLDINGPIFDSPSKIQKSPMKTYVPMDFSPYFSQNSVDEGWVATLNTRLELEMVSQIYVERNGNAQHRTIVPNDKEVVFNYDWGTSGYPSMRPSYRTTAGKQFGQDVSISTSDFIGCFDGHSKNSEKISGTTSEVCQRIFSSSDFKSTMISLLKSNNHQTVETFIRDTYNKIREKVDMLPETECAGTTVSTCHHFNSGNRRWLVFVNLGDSEGYIVNNNSGRVLIATNSHSWDNPAVYQQYIDSCFARQIVPKDAIYSRFNNGFSDSYKIPNQYNETDKPYKIFDINDGNVMVNKENRDYIWWKLKDMYGIVGGFQGLPKLLMENVVGVFPDLRPLVNTEHLNWGSTGLTEYSCQSMTGFGDKNEHISSGVDKNMIHVYIHELASDEDVTAIVASDGFSDCIYKYRIGEIISELTRSNISAENISYLLMNEAKQLAIESVFGWGKDEISIYTKGITTNNSFSKHDDMSLSLFRSRPV